MQRREVREVPLAQEGMAVVVQALLIVLSDERGPIPLSQLPPAAVVAVVFEIPTTMRVVSKARTMSVVGETPLPNPPIPNPKSKE